MRATLGIDIGTSAVKVAALAMDGTLLGEASRAYPTKRPRPGWVEQAPADWWGAVCSAVAALRADLPDCRFAGIGLSGQVNGMVLLDKDDEVLGDAMIWLDTRSAAEADELQRRHGDLLRSGAATQLSAIAVLAKLAWLGRHDGERLARTRSILMVKDYVLWRLTGVKMTDPTDAASTGMFDLASFAWISELCAAAGFDKALLPPVGRSTEVAGHVTRQAAVETGLTQGTPVVPGGGDVSALAVGCGVSRPNVLGITLGTAGHVVLAEQAGKVPDIGNGIWCLPHADTAQLIWLGLVMSGGLSLSWLHGLIASAGSGLSFERMAALAEGVPPGSNGISFVPFLEGAATPYVNPSVRGVFTGLTPSTRAGDLVRAVMEGVAFNVRQCVALFAASGGTVSEIRIAEGGARIGLWCQIVADVLGQPVIRLDYLNTSSIGAAMMAQTALGGVSLDGLAGTVAARGRRFLPDADSSAAYEAAFRRYVASAESEVARVSGSPG